MSFSIVLPCFNEEENIARTVRDVLSWFVSARIDGEVIVVNDGSRDRSGTIIDALAKEDPRVKAVHHPVNQGYGAAVRTGCDHASKDIIGFMDSDGQFHAEDFGRLLPLIDQFALVTGYRKKRADPLYRLINAKLYSFLVWLVLGVHPRDLNCAMKIFRKDLWPRIRPERGLGALFNAEVFYRLRQSGIPWSEVAVPHYQRVAGHPTGASPFVIFRMFRELVALRKSVRRVSE